MVAMNYTVLVEGVILLFLAVVYFFHKSKYVHIACGLGILLMAYVMHFPTIALLVIGISVFAISYFFLKTRNKARMFAFIILLFLLPTLVLAADKNDTIKIDVEKVKYVDEVLKVTQQPTMRFMGTDYVPGDDGKLLSFITVGEFPVETASCYASVLYPNMSGYFIENYLMNQINKSYFTNGHFLDFVVPNVTGIYPVSSYCFFNSSSIRDNVDYFITNITIASGELANLIQFDNKYIEFKGDGLCKLVNCEVAFYFSLPTGFYTSFLRDFRNDIKVWTDRTSKFEVWAYNFDTDSKDNLFNFTKDSPIVPTSFQNELNSSHVSPDSQVVIGIDVYNFDNGVMRVHYDHLDRVYNGSDITDLRGNGELSVSQGIYNISVEINGEIDFVDTDTSILIILLVIVLFLLFIRQEAFSGLFLGLWTLLYSPNIYITILFLLLSVVMIWWGISRRQQ